MKTFLLFSFCIFNIESYAQENLQFYNAIFLQLQATKTSKFMAKDTLVVVPKGKVWQITNTNVSVRSQDNEIKGYKAYLYLNECIIATTHFVLQNFDPIWLPSGQCRISIRTEEKNQGEGLFYYDAFLSGIEYNSLK